MGKGSLAVLLLVVLAMVAIGFCIRGVEAGGDEGVRLGLSFGATVILVIFVFFLALYLGRIRTRGLYVLL